MATRKSRFLVHVASIFILSCVFAASAMATPKDDLKKYQEFFKNRFPNFTLVDFSNGMYNFSEDKKNQYEAIMEIPPYEASIDEGKDLFEESFANGKSYASCFENKGIGIAQNYPRFDAKSGKVKTLAAAVNDCRVANGEKPLEVLKDNMAKILAYLADTSRGKPVNIVVPDDKRALAAYEDGKRVYFSRRGPREFACYHCHWETSGMRIRGNELSPALGQAANFPVYRSDWGEIGTLQRRYKGCMNNIGAVPLEEESEAMNNLEYFHTFLSNGVPMNAPNSRF